MGRRKKGRCTKKNKQINIEEKKELVEAPHSFVIQRGLPGEHVIELTKDFRRIMEPFTATSLKARRRNTIKDFVSVAGLLHVTHMCIFTRTELGMYLKLCRLPRGPTLTFRVQNFSLARDVVSMLKKQLVYEEAFKTSPLIILNNFSSEGMQLKLVASTFQNMFPTINLTTVNLSSIRRCLCLNYNPESKTIDLRHYAIKVVPVGLSRNVKKIVQSKVPNLSKCQDYSEFLSKGTLLSESEAEDDEESHIKLSQKLSSRGNLPDGTSAIRLSELGPRLTLQLIKIEEGLLDGEVLFHELVEKSEEEKLAIKKKRDEKKRLKEKRKKMQEENKLKKEQKKQEHKDKSLKGIQKKREGEMSTKNIATGLNESNKIEADKDDDDDDAAYYKEEIGEEADKDLFNGTSSKKRSRVYTPSYKSKKIKR